MTFWRKWFTKKKESPDRVPCSECGRPRHKHDRIVIDAWHHADCGDPKKVGQLSMPAKDDQ